MPSLECGVFSKNGEISETILANFVVKGTSDAVQEAVKRSGWDGSSPNAAVGITVNKEGELTQSELFLMGTKDSIKISATVLFGGDRDENDIVKISSINLADFLFKESLVSDWIDNSDFTWVYREFNPATGKYKETQHIDEPGLKRLKITKLFLRCSLAPIAGPKLHVKLGVAPCDDIKNMAGNTAQNFPIISINKEFNATLLPEEPIQANWGLGLTPFLIYLDESLPVFPSSMAIKQAVAGLLKNVVKPTMKTKHRTWMDVVGGGQWEEIPTNFMWPDPLPETDETEELGAYLLKS